MDGEELEAIKRWWGQDWSWSGLARRPHRRSLGHGREREQNAAGTLQDAWRTEEEHLIPFGATPDGQPLLWTRFHLPPCTANGTPCDPAVWKSAKDAAAAALPQRLSGFALPDEDALERTGHQAVTAYAELCGVVFREVFIFAPRALVADFSGAIFMEGISLANKRIAARFDTARFFRDARFKGSVFASGTNFHRARFLQGARFKGTAFSGESRFDDALFAGKATFERARFLGDTRFDDAVFRNQVSFGAPRNSAFDFMGKVNFERCEFLGDADFTGREFRGATSFSQAHFRGLAFFHGARLHPETIVTRDAFDVPAAARKAAKSWFDDEAKRTGAAARQGPAPWLWRWRNFVFGLDSSIALRWPKMEPVRTRVNDVMTGHELALRALRLQFAEHRNTENELMFYGLEMDARRARASLPFFFEGLFAFLYKHSSNYGQDLLRPVVCFLALWAAAAGLLLLLQLPGADQSLSVLAANSSDWVLHRLIPFENLSGHDAVIADNAFVIPGLETLLALLLPAASVGLLTVFLIALRRRFQIDRG